MTANLQTDDVSAIGGGAGVPSGDFLDEATALFREAAGELFGALRGLRRGRTEEAKAAAQAVKDLKQALEWVMDERNRCEKYRKSAAGVVGTRAHDLDAARDEIGRRLACLRNARDD